MAQGSSACVGATDSSLNAVCTLSSLLVFHIDGDEDRDACEMLRYLTAEKVEVLGATRLIDWRERACSGLVICMVD